MNHALWYLNRGSGVVLVAVLTLSVVLGVLATSAPGSRRWPRFALQTLHRNVALIACGLLLAHAVSPVLDTYVNHYTPLGWLDVVVPFVSSYKTVALGLGTLALDLLVVVVVSSLLRHRLSSRTWFRLHLLTYASWVLGVVHGFLAGTDARTVWGLGVSVGSAVAVLVAVAVRLTRGRPVADGPVTDGPVTNGPGVHGPDADGLLEAPAPAHSGAGATPGRRRSGRRAA